MPYPALYYIYFSYFSYSIPYILGIISGKSGAAVQQPGALTTELRRTLRAKTHPSELRRILMSYAAPFSYQCCGSVTFGTDPDPAIFVLDLRDANKKQLFSKFFCLLLIEDKKS